MNIIRGIGQQRLQVGLEAGGAEGTPVAANKRLMEVFGPPRPRNPQVVHRPANALFPIDTSKQHEFSELAFNGYVGFNSLAYIVAAMFGGTGFSAKPDIDNVTVPQTLTVQVGSAAGAEAIAGAFVRDLAFTFGMAEVTYNGVMVGQPIDEAASMTAAPDTVPTVTGDFPGLEVYMGAAVGSLAELTKAKAANFGIRGWNQPQFFLGTAGFSDISRNPPDLSAGVTIVHDSASKALMPYLRARDKRFCRIKFTGPEYGVGTPYIFQLTFPFKFDERDQGEMDSAVVAPYSLVPIYDATFAGTFELSITTDYAAL